MKQTWWLLCVVLLLGACATVDSPAPDSSAEPAAATRDVEPASADAPVAEPGFTPATAPVDPDASLLVHRAALCAGSVAERRRQLLSPADKADYREQFQRLLLASCDPWQHRHELRQALEVASLKRDWSEDEQAFLRLLQTQQEALQQQLQHTIRGISDIEDVIEQRPDSGPLTQARES